MDKYISFKEKLEKRQKIVGASISLFHNTFILEKMIERCDLDFILFDSEHGVFDTVNLVPSLSTMRLLGTPSIVRVEDAKYNLVAKAVDMGADGIMIPRTETIEQVKTAIDGLFFPPIGRKGLGGHGQMRKGEKHEDFYKTRFLFLQIESIEGLNNLPQILETYGEYVSAIVVGPYDLSATMGIPFEFRNPKHVQAVQKIFDVSKAYNKSVGIFCDDENAAKFYRDMGANFLWMSIDREYFLRGLKCFIDGVKDI